MPNKQWTIEEIKQQQTENGGYSKAALATLGVDWPPTKGWRERLQRGEDPNVESPDAIFVRLDPGAWAIRVTCKSREIVPGMSVTVCKRDGSTCNL
jgi:hypothetical protein